MKYLIAFKDIAPYLTDPLVLFGFVLLLFVILLITTIKTKFLPKKTADKISNTMISLFFILALVIVVLGFVFKIYRQSTPGEAFDFTIFVKDTTGKAILINSGMFSLQIGNAKPEELVDGKGMVIFKQIPATFKKTKATLTIETNGWHFENGKPTIGMILEGVSKDIVVERDLVPCIIFGSIINVEGHPVYGASVCIDSFAVLTDSCGRFSLEIPPNYRNTKQMLLAQKGKLRKRKLVHPSSKQEVTFILNQE
jgi:hypothetical protein